MHMSVDPFYPIGGNIVVLSIRTVGLGKFDGISFHMIDSAHLLSAGRDDIHMFFDVVR